MDQGYFPKKLVTAPIARPYLPAIISVAILKIQHFWRNPSLLWEGHTV